MSEAAPDTFRGDEAMADDIYTALGLGQALSTILEYGEKGDGLEQAEAQAGRVVADLLLSTLNRVLGDHTALQDAGALKHVGGAA